MAQPQSPFVALYDSEEDFAGAKQLRPDLPELVCIVNYDKTFGQTAEQTAQSNG